MTRALPYELIDPLTGRPIEELSPTIQENRSEQNLFDQAFQFFDYEGKTFILPNYHFFFLVTFLNLL